MDMILNSRRKYEYDESINQYINANVMKALNPDIKAFKYNYQ